MPTRSSARARSPSSASRGAPCRARRWCCASRICGSPTTRSSSSPGRVVCQWTGWSRLAAGRRWPSSSHARDGRHDRRVRVGAGARPGHAGGTAPFRRARRARRCRRRDGHGRGRRPRPPRGAAGRRAAREPDQLGMVGAARCGDRVDPRPRADGAGGRDPPTGRAARARSRGHRPGVAAARGRGRLDRCPRDAPRGAGPARRARGSRAGPAVVGAAAAVPRRRAGGPVAAHDRGVARRPGVRLPARRAHGGGVRGSWRRRRRDRVARAGSGRACTRSMDTGRIVPYVQRISELAATGHPWAVALDAVCRGAAALLVRRDWRAAEAILAPVAAEPSADATQGLAGYFCARAQVEGGRLQEAARTIDCMPDDHRERMHDGVLGIRAAVAQGLGSTDAVLDEIRALAEARLDRRPFVARRIARCGLAVGHAVVGDLDAARAAARARARRRTDGRDARRGAGGAADGGGRGRQ